MELLNYNFLHVWHHVVFLMQNIKVFHGKYYFHMMRRGIFTRQDVASTRHGVFTRLNVAFPRDELWHLYATHKKSTYDYLWVFGYIGT